MTALLIGLAHRVPVGVWISAILGNIVLTILTWSVARRRIRRAGERSAHPERFADRSRRRDIALTVASLIPAGLFWLMVLAGSFHGLVAFGRDVLGWREGSEYLVPGTLDGVSVTFGLLAFRAIHRRRDPGRGQRVVWAASLASATVNFAYEYGYTANNVIAGLYTALLSVFGVVIFHEFLAQFEEGAEYIRRSKRPPWGLRWLTAPYSTICSAIAWENFPPADGTPATVLNGLANLERARRLKRNAIEVRILERHSRAIAAAQRKAELAEAKANPASVPAVDDAASSDEDEAVPDAGASDAPTDPRVVPTTASTVEQWAAMWVRMTADGDLVHGSLNDDVYARRVYGVSGRQLSNIRCAVVTGALARRAYEQGADLDGYVWGVKWQVLYPGITLLTQSEHAQTWSTTVGIPFYEARVETNGHNLSLVFADLDVAKVEQGYAPFVVPGGGPDFKIPLG